MISQYIQNLIRPAKMAHPASAGSSFGLPASTGNGVGNLFDRVRRLVVEIDRKRRLEYEYRKAIAQLESLTDEQLLDVGIARPDIEYAVRHGKQPV